MQDSNKSSTAKRAGRRQRKDGRYASKIDEFKKIGEGAINIVDKGKRSEIYIQCNLYIKLTMLGYDARLELPYKIEGRHAARFDVVVFHPKGDIIIEVKRSGRKATAAQVRKYKKFRAELVFCQGRADIGKTISYIRERYPIDNRPMDWRWKEREGTW